MIKKMTLLAGIGAGYVLGAKAGRERYDQIARFAAGVRQKPEVQRATATVQQAVHHTAADVHDKTIDLVNEQVEKVAPPSAP